jgi:hypothetical protein
MARDPGSFYVTPRHVVAEYLRGDALLGALLPGGIYPSEGGDEREIARTITPLAFDNAGDVRPCALVGTEGTVNFGPLPNSMLTIVRVFLYERKGRDAIDAAGARIAAVLAPADLAFWDQPAHVRFIGFSADTERDPTLRDADIGWCRVQVNHLTPWGRANGY